MKALTARWAGDRSLILDFDTLEDAMAACAALNAAPLPGQVDVVAGARTALVRLRSHWHTLRALPALAAAEFPSADTPDAAETVIDVGYDGLDLAELADTLDMSPEALVSWHTGQTWLGAFGGVAGFVYCVPQDTALAVPRRVSPRTAVPDGSVILAAEFSGIYPRTGPSGWQIIGRTDIRMWEPDREQPALLRPWDIIRYRPVRPEAVLGVRTDAAQTDATEATAATVAPSSDARADAESQIPERTGSPALVVLDRGLQTLIQDLGREGAARAGAGVSGVIDRPAAVVANHLVGNGPEVPVLESLFGGLRVRSLISSVLAAAGADATVTVESPDGSVREEGVGRPFLLLSGEVLTVGHPPRGARTVLALRGGVEVPRTLGSASTDTHIGIGPSPVSAGDVLHAGSPLHAVAPSQHSTGAREAFSPVPVEREDVVLHVVLGPRDGWFSPDELNRFATQRWRVTPASDRIGIRLEPTESTADTRLLARPHAGELLSEGMALGSVQVPPAGEPILLLNDQAITGGYPTIAVVIRSDLPRAGQLAPGDWVRFQPVEPVSLRPVTPTEGTPT